MEKYYLRKNGEEFQLTNCKKCIKKVSETINLFDFSLGYSEISATRNEIFNVHSIFTFGVSI